MTRTATRVVQGLALAVLLVACAPAAPAPAPTAAPSADAAAQSATDREWEEVLAAAKSEGKVVVASPTGAAARDALLRFADFYPEIQLELVPLSQAFPQRVLPERQAGLYLWDVNVGGPNTGFLHLQPNGVLDPVRPLIRPALQRDELWLGGFDFGWGDTEKQYIFMFSISAAAPIGVNRDFVSRQELDHPRQIVDPRWKGKIVFEDPTQAGPGSQFLSVLLNAYGEDFARQLLRDQEPMITRDRRQLVEWIVRGRYPIGVGSVSGGDLVPFQQAGLGLNIEPVASPEVVGLNAGPGAVMAINRAPHPNAQKVFINWLLSREGQELWAVSQYNSRRTDVAPTVPAEYPDLKHVTSMVWNNEAWEPVRQRTERLAKEMLGS
jgi:ABC-type Fe3+ transport system substrate-binding protein